MGCALSPLAPARSAVRSAPTSMSVVGASRRRAAPRSQFNDVVARGGNGLRLIASRRSEQGTATGSRHCQGVACRRIVVACTKRQDPRQPNTTLVVHRAWPNHSFKLTRYGSQPWPRGAEVHVAPRGQGCLPPRAA